MFEEQPKKSDKTPTNSQAKANEKKKTVVQTGDGPKQPTSTTTLADGLKEGKELKNSGSNSKLDGGSPRSNEKDQTPRGENKQEKEPAVPKEISAIVSSIAKELEEISRSYVNQIYEILTDMNTHKELEKSLKDAKLYYRLHEHLCSLYLNTTSNVFSTYKESLDIFREFTKQKASVFDREQPGKLRLEEAINKKLVLSTPFVEEKYRKTEDAIKKRIQDFFKDPLAAENKREFELVSFDHADKKDIERNFSAKRGNSSVDPNQKKKKTDLQRKVQEGIVQKSFTSIASIPSAAAVSRSKEANLHFSQYCQAADLSSLADMYIKGMGRCDLSRHPLLRQRAAGVRPQLEHSCFRLQPRLQRQDH